MAKRVLLLFYLIIQTFLLCGYVQQPMQIRPVVTQIDVYHIQNGELTHLSLTDTEQMEAVLGCLRAVDPHFPAEEQPPPLRGDLCTVRVGLANGKCHIYQQLSEGYFSEDLGTWKTVDPKQGAQLFSLLRTLEASGFQGAFLFCEAGSFLSKFFDKTTKKDPPAFV